MIILCLFIMIMIIFIEDSYFSNMLNSDLEQTHFCVHITLLLFEREIYAANIYTNNICSMSLLLKHYF